jgi:hypothetical protein
VFKQHSGLANLPTLVPALVNNYIHTSRDDRSDFIIRKLNRVIILRFTYLATVKICSTQAVKNSCTHRNAFKSN